MKLKVLRSIILILTVSLLIKACANKSQPTGGPKDEKPPKLVASTPKHKQTNYTDKTFELEFDEYVKLESAKEQLIITPRIDQEYTIDYRKEKVIIKFEEPLQENTTYTFNFREAVKDLTEGNSPEDLILAFSTGPLLDSMYIEGTVTDLLLNKPVQEATIALFDENDTLDMFTGPPLYLGKTKADGSYKIENIKVGRYRIGALKDNNKNLTVEARTDEYGFLKELINLDTPVTAIDIPIQHLDISEFKMQSARVSGHYYILKFNKFVRAYELDFKDTTTQIYTTLSEDSKEIKFYNTFDIADSLTTYLTAYDTMYQETLDTVYVKFEESKRKYDPFKTEVTESNMLASNYDVSLKLKFTKPILDINKDSINIMLDTIRNLPITEIFDMQWNQYYTELDLTGRVPKDSIKLDSLELAQASESNRLVKQESVPKAASQLQFALGKGAFISADKDSSEAGVAAIKVIKESEFGTINLKTSSEFQNFFVQLLSEKNEVVSEFKNKSKHKFTWVKPGSYRLRVLIDADNNGRWDAGNFYEKLEPEPVKFYMSEDSVETFTIRANWELDDILFKF